jgi:hypothetical protein
MLRALNAIGSGTSTVSAPRQPDPRVAEFITQLRAFWGQCGSPPPARLIKISQNLSQRYPAARKRLEGLPPLSKSAISEIMAGKRKHLPQADWLAIFVLSCQHFGFSVGALTDDAGMDGVHVWQEKLRSAQLRGSGAASWPDAAFRLPDEQREYLADYGPVGIALRDRAESGDLEAMYIVALLLGVHRPMSRAAMMLLLRASAAGHCAAVELLDEYPDRLPPPDACADRAWTLALAAMASGDRAYAEVLCTAAARGGSLGAAHLLARLAGLSEGEAGTTEPPTAAGDSAGPLARLPFAGDSPAADSPF